MTGYWSIRTQTNSWTGQIAQWSNCGLVKLQTGQFSLNRGSVNSWTTGQLLNSPKVVNSRTGLSQLTYKVDINPLTGNCGFTHGCQLPKGLATMDESYSRLPVKALR